MSFQIRHAEKGKEFKPTYSGRFLTEKFEKEPKYRKQCPKRWITEGYVTEENIKEDE